MDFSLSDEQLLLRESVEKYVADHGGVERHRQLSRTELGYDPAAWRAFAELGWLALPFAEADGGLGGGPTDLMVLCEALGRGLVREPYLHTAITCGGLLSALADGSQRAEYLVSLMEGNVQWAFAFAEEGGGYELAAPQCSAQASPDGFELNGRKMAVFNGHTANQLLVTARLDDDAFAVFLVDADSAGLSRESFSAVDGSRGADLQLAAVAVPKESCLADGDKAVAAVESVLDRAIIALGAESVGAMQVLLDTTVEYSKTREQFGQPIGKFQALQHRMADMYLKLEETRSLLYNAAILLEEGDAAAPAACAALKVKLGEAGRFISHEAVQVHGGIGMTDEMIVSHLFKRLLLLAKLYGDDAYHLDRYLRLSPA